MRRLGMSVLAVAFAAGLSIAYAGAASASSSAIASKRIVIGPHQSIQRAVDNAKPGTTIVLRPGVYHQMVLIRKDKITLRGSGARRTVIKPPRHATSNLCTMVFGETGICIVAKKATSTGRVIKTVRSDTISNLSVVGFRSSGVFGYGTVGLTVRHVTAINDGDYGISRFNSTETRFTQDVAIGNHEAGFYVGDSPDADTVVRDDRAVGNQLGIFIRHAREVMVSRNYVAGNCQGILVLDDGQSGGAGNALITKNIVIHNNKSCPRTADTPGLQGGGILLLGATHTRVIANFVKGNAGQQINSGGIVVASAMALTHGSDPKSDTIKNNEAHANQPADLIWDGSGTSVRFTGNHCTMSVPPGLCN
jgi:parallel beta helix pectate lyase-like protein